MSLTDNPLENNVHSRKKIVLISLSILLIVLVILALVKFVFPGNKPTEKGEDKFPAIKVQILNGCGFEGLAGEYQEYIKDENISVDATGDTAKPIYDKSVIVVRKGDMEDLERLQKMTGIKRYTIARTDDSVVDFDIIIGRDFDEYMK
ncbi:MAG TPA: LytR C-terminal domain-containing protein [Candidatus Cloacimonadota bacterium]|nr:LytR C-terminal domain-containing protein [Candidatus Cloacimonadota bacterium]HPS38191.1 LytR C-terminal domain-containing protein [Candidatus Cloacimonadota bacterium]